ncbi:MAG: hypothetical protein HC939_07795 [Pleurocapsa sp. SU_5_0]|nr:hypothetical protein [Pleurocapsa sp. SU_5_0]
MTNSQESSSHELLITQLLPQEQQLIAQVWSDIATEQLSLATPSATNSESSSNELLITQLLPQEQTANCSSLVRHCYRTIELGNSQRD